mmetsp:Transcript_3503/g.10083  ORF Transcript_3503/g.10083 Transcript_3503/m.10083 type:complete len:214 (-) Transcript_3503:928-1569(-)
MRCCTLMCFSRSASMDFWYLFSSASRAFEKSVSFLLCTRSNIDNSFCILASCSCSSGSNGSNQSSLSRPSSPPPALAAAAASAAGAADSSMGRAKGCGAAPLSAKLTRRVSASAGLAAPAAGPLVCGAAAASAPSPVAAAVSSPVAAPFAAFSTMSWFGSSPVAIALHTFSTIVARKSRSVSTTLSSSMMSFFSSRYCRRSATVLTGSSFGMA